MVRGRYRSLVPERRPQITSAPIASDDAGPGLAHRAKTYLVGTFRVRFANPLRPVPSIALKIEKNRYQLYFCPAGSSYGAPVPVEPRNKWRPSARVISLPFALCDPSLDWYPSTMTLVPGSRASFLKPRRNKTFGVPASKAQFSTLPSGFFTST